MYLFCQQSQSEPFPVYGLHVFVHITQAGAHIPCVQTDINEIPARLRVNHHFKPINHSQEFISVAVMYAGEFLLHEVVE